MPDFTARVAGSAVVEDWADDRAPTGNGPRHLRHVVDVAGLVAVLVTPLELGGVEAPVDSALGGRTFEAWFLEAPEPPALTVPVAHSTVISFQPLKRGHHTLQIRRLQSGGALILHFDAR